MKFLKITKLISFFLLISNISFAFKVGDSFIVNKDNTLQTASKTYKNSNGEKIILLANVHAGKEEFFNSHEEILKQATHVLYEGLDLGEEGRIFFSSELGKKQRLIYDSHLLLAATFNLKCLQDYIDYSKDNFIYTDQTFGYWIKSQGFDNHYEHLNSIKKDIAFLNEKYGENGCEQYFNIKIKQIKDSMTLESFCKEVEKGANVSKDEVLKVEPKFNERNEIVLNELAKILKNSVKNQNDHIIIYYGAAHMPYFEKAISDMGFEPDSEEWITAISYSSYSSYFPCSIL